jgi:hypothetical protein
MRPLVWRDERIDWWYRQNTLLFVKQESEDTFARVVSKELGPPTGEPMALVHPEAFVHFATYADTRRVVRALPRIASRMARNRTAAVRNRINTSRT